MFNLHVLLGQTFAGKSTVKQEINNLNIDTLITSTTRPKRTGEKDGRDYYFVDNQTVQQKFMQQELIAPRNFNMVDQEVTYFLDANELKNRVKNHQAGVLIIDPKGYFDLFEYLKQTSDPLLKQIKLYGWYLKVPLKLRMQRYLTGDRQNEDPKETLRRLYDDQFHAFKEIENPHFDTQKYHLKTVTTKIELLQAISFIELQTQQQKGSSKHE